MVLKKFEVKVLSWLAYHVTHQHTGLADAAVADDEDLEGVVAA